MSTLVASMRPTRSQLCGGRDVRWKMTGFSFTHGRMCVSAQSVRPNAVSVVGTSYPTVNPPRESVPTVDAPCY